MEKLESLMAEIDAIGFDLSPKSPEQLQATRERLREIQQRMLSDPDIAALVARVNSDPTYGRVEIRRILPNVTRISKSPNTPGGTKPN